MGLIVWFVNWISLNQFPLIDFVVSFVTQIPERRSARHLLNRLARWIRAPFPAGLYVSFRHFLLRKSLNSSIGWRKRKNASFVWIKRRKAISECIFLVSLFFRVELQNKQLQHHLHAADVRGSSDGHGRLLLTNGFRAVGQSRYRWAEPSPIRVDPL